MKDTFIKVNEPIQLKQLEGYTLVKTVFSTDIHHKGIVLFFIKNDDMRKLLITTDGEILLQVPETDNDLSITINRSINDDWEQRVRRVEKKKLESLLRFLN